MAFRFSGRFNFKRDIIFCDTSMRDLVFIGTLPLQLENETCIYGV